MKFEVHIYTEMFRKGRESGLRYGPTFQYPKVLYFTPTMSFLSTCSPAKLSHCVQSPSLQADDTAPTFQEKLSGTQSPDEPLSPATTLPQLSPSTLA